MSDFGALNWAILVVYLLLNLGLGFALSHRVKTARDFYLGRRATPWWAIGISVVATYVSALSFLGGPAWAYSEGLGVMAIHLNYPLVVVLVVTLFLPFFYNSGVPSIYEYIERRFGARSRGVIAGLFLGSQMLTSAAILYATALVLHFITGIDVRFAIVSVALIALVYTMLGGITAVIWTDVVQAGVLLVGVIAVFIALLQRLPMPLPELLFQLSQQGKLNPLDPTLDFTRETTVWSGVVAMTLFHVTVYGANQMMVQRTLAAKSIGDAKKSFLLMGFSAFFIYFAFLFLGVLFYGYYEGRPFDDGNTIILRFASGLEWPGLMGVIASAIVAASMSSLDSSLNSMATVSTVDFYQRYLRPRQSSEHYLRASRVFTVAWALAIIGPALFYVDEHGSILRTLSKLGSYFVGAKLSMYGLGFFSKHTSERGLLVGVAAGFLVVWAVASGTNLSWPWYCVVGGAVNTAVALPASLLLDGPQQRWSPYTIVGQQQLFAAEERSQRDGGWHLMPGRVDRISYVLLAFFVGTVLWLLALQVWASG